MRVLVICDDYWHPAAVPRSGLPPLEASGFEFDWIENAADWSAEKMEAYRVVMLIKSDNVSAADQTHWVTAEVESAFLTYVSRGGGLLGVHSGTASYEHMPVLRSLLGGVFLQHPDQCLVTVHPLEGHTLTQGSASFTVQDEHYFMALDDPQADVFLTTVSEHGSQPGGWTRYEGEGRVCILTPGHNLEVWLDPSYQTLLANGLNWCAKEI